MDMSILYPYASMYVVLIFLALPVVLVSPSALMIVALEYVLCCLSTANLFLKLYMCLYFVLVSLSYKN